MEYREKGYDYNSTHEIAQKKYNYQKQLWSTTMLLLKKKEVTNNKISYYYQPEFKGEMGIVSYLLYEKKFIVEKLAELDTEYVSVFRRHALEHILIFIANKDYPDEKKIYWGL